MCAPALALYSATYVRLPGETRLLKKKIRCNEPRNEAMLVTIFVLRILVFHPQSSRFLSLEIFACLAIEYKQTVSTYLVFIT